VLGAVVRLVHTRDAYRRDIGVWLTCDAHDVSSTMPGAATLTATTHASPSSAEDSDIPSKYLSRVPQPTDASARTTPASLDASRSDGSWLMLREGYLVLVKIRTYTQLARLPHAA